MKPERAWNRTIQKPSRITIILLTLCIMMPNGRLRCGVNLESVWKRILPEQLSIFGKRQMVVIGIRKSNITINTWKERGCREIRHLLFKA